MGLLIHSPVDGHLDCFQFGPIVSKAVVNCIVCIHFTRFFTVGGIPGSRITGPCFTPQTEELSFPNGFHIFSTLTFFSCFFVNVALTYLRLPRFKSKDIPADVILAEGKGARPTASASDSSVSK